MTSHQNKSKKSNKVKPKSKISPPKTQNLQILDVPPFHVMFPITLTYKEGKSIKNCYFQAEDHLKKYLIRANLKPKDCQITTTEPRQLSNDED